MKAKHLVNTWYKISLGEDIGNSDVFFKFISLWVCFNGIYNSITNRSDSERDQIECFSGLEILALGPKRTR